MEPNLALPGQSSTLSRIHETSAKFQRYKILLRRRWWFLLLTASIGVCVQALRITSKPQSYVSLAKLVAGGRMVVGGSAVGYQEYLNDFYGTIIETLESSEMRKHALERVRLLYPDLKEADVEVRVSQNRGSAIFNVAVVGSDHEYSQVFLNALLDEFKAFREMNREQQRNKAVQALAEDVVKADKEVRENADKLASFEKLHNVVVINQNQNEAAQMLSQFNREREALRVHLTEVEMALKDVDAAMLQKEASASGGQRGPGNTSQKLVNDTAATDASLSQPSLGLTSNERDYLELKHSILLLTADRDELLRSYKPGHPAVMEMEDKIAKQKGILATYQAQILEEQKSQQAVIVRKVQVLDGKILEETQQATEVGALLAEHSRLRKNLEASENTHKEVFDLMHKFTVSEDVQGDYVNVMERASKAVEDVQQWAVAILLGLGAGLGIGVVVLLLFDRLDDRMNSFSEFQSLFPNEAILGQIPEQRQRGDVALLRSADDRHLYAEAFRNVRSSVLFKNWRGKPPKTILITSAVPNEGKTTVTSNLAITMALAGSRVLLADCDLRRGGVSELFKLPTSPGLSEALQGTVHWRDAVQETGVRNLDLLARGEVFDQTSEMLLSRIADEMLKEMADEYDYVIFDSAPVLVADDTGSFAPKLDTVLFVVRMSSTMARLTGKALDLLYDRQVNVGGVILNRSSSSLKEYTYYNYASYYYTPKAPAPPASSTPPTA
ncbi:MAG: hypothetical protein JWO94_2389 [Verrucomicrobiaceae bacterium]|nr:hypothetical protein [Verrucomicrobiaceae bacterium]